MNGEFPPNVVELIQRQLSQFGRVGATKIMRCPSLAAPLAAVIGTEGSPQPIQFREKGIVIAMYGQELAGTVANFASTELRIRIGGSEDIITDGSSGTFAPLLALFGPNLNWFPLWRRVVPAVNWQVTWRTMAAVAADPALCLAFIADADLERMARQASR